MSKDLSEETKYEFNVYARQLNKDLSNLMDCLRKQDEDNKAILYVGRHVKKKVILPYEEYQKMCQRLESIDNSSPSKALESLEDIYTFSEDTIYQFEKEYDTIKQALLKSQEQEKVLEIIKKKKINIDLLYASSSVEQYNDELVIIYGMWFVKDRQLTEEEFDLLKRYCDEQNN